MAPGERKKKTMKLEMVNGAVEVTTPYNPDFVSKIKAMGAQWEGTKKVWKVDARAIELVRGVMRDVYGQDDSPQILVDVRVTFAKEQEKTQQGITLFGRIIASARSRDGGAELGEDVVLESGKITSGGSRQYWTTIIKQGTTLMLYDLPLAAVENKLGWNDEMGSFEIVDPQPQQNISRQALEEERSALEARIAEINALLSN